MADEERIGMGPARDGGSRRARSVFLAVLLALGLSSAGCYAPVLVAGGYTEASSADEVLRWPEDLSGGTQDPLPLYEQAEKVAGAVQDRCVSRRNLDVLTAGGEAPEQVRIESIRVSTGMPAANWLLFPYNLLSAATFGIVPMVFLHDREVSLTALLEGPAGGTAPVTAAASDSRAEWIFYPLAPGPRFTWIGGKWDSPAFTRNLEAEAASDLLRALAGAPLGPPHGNGGATVREIPISVPCFSGAHPAVP